MSNIAFWREVAEKCVAKGVPEEQQSYGFRDDDLNALVNIGAQYGVYPEVKEQKQGMFRRLVSLLQTGETASAAMAALEGDDPLKAYGQHIGKSLQSAATGKGYDATTYKDVLYKALGKPTSKFGEGVYTAAGIVGDVLLDPTTYITFGIGKGPKAGGIALKKSAKPAMQKTAKEYAEKTAQKLIDEGAEESFTQISQRLMKSPEAMKYVRDEWARKIIDGVPEYTKHIDKGGFKVAGQTVVPGDTLKSLVARPYKKISQNEGVKLVNRLFNRDAGLSEAQKLIKQNWLDTTRYNLSKDFDEWVDLMAKVPKKKDRVAITNALELGDDGIKALPKNLQEIAEQVRKTFDGYAGRGVDNGILDGTLKNYVPHIYKADNSDEVLDRIARFEPQRISSNFKFAKRRQVNSIEEAKRLLLEPEEDIAKIGAMYINSFNKAEGNAKYMRDLVKKLGQDPEKTIKEAKTVTEEIVEQVLNPEFIRRPYHDMLKQIVGRDLKLPVPATDGEAIEALTKALQDPNIVSKIGADKVDDIRTLLGKAPDTLETWDDVAQLRSLVKDPVIGKDYDNFFTTFKDGIESMGGQIGKTTEYVDHVKEVDKVIDVAKNVPLSQEELQVIEKGLGETLVPFSDKSVGQVLLPESVVKDLRRNTQLFENPDVNFMLRQYDRLLNFWKGSVTSLFPAFHARNSASNVAQNFLDIGLDSINPARHNDALKVMMGADGIFKTDLGTEIPYKQLKEIAEKKGVLGGNFFYTDAARALDDQLKTGMRRGIKKLNPFEGGRWIGGQIEDEARLVNFLSNVRRGLDYDDAAKSTKKFLFDYGNLSKFEKDVMRRFLPFYTWTRKNIGLQAMMLATKPGMVSAELKAVRGIGEPITEEERQTALPEWAAEQAGFQKGTDEFGRPLYFTGLGMPLEAALSMNDAKSWFSSLSPMIKGPIELVTGYDVFRGRPIQEIYKANEVGAIVNSVAEATGQDASDIRESLGISSYERDVYVNNERTGRKETVYTMNPYVLYMLRTMPTSRLMGTLGYATDSQKTEFEKLLKLLTGVKAYSFDEDQQIYFKERDIKEKLEQDLVEQGVIGTGSYFYERKK